LRLSSRFSEQLDGGFSDGKTSSGELFSGALMNDELKSREIILSPMSPSNAKEDQNNGKLLLQSWKVTELSI